MGAGGVGAAAGERGLRRRIGREYGHDHLAYHFFGVGGVYASFHCCRSYVAMQCDGAGNRKF